MHQHPEQLSFHDLKSHRQIIVRDLITHTRYNEDCSGTKCLDLDMHWTVSHLRDAIDMVSQNLGFAWLPITHISYLIDNKTLKALNLAQGATRALRLYLTCHDTDRLGPAAQEFKEQLKIIINKT